MQKHVALGLLVSSLVSVGCGGASPPPPEPAPTPEAPPPPPRREAVGSVISGTNGTSMLSASVPLDGGHLVSFELRGAQSSPWVQLSYVREDAIVLQIGDNGFAAEAPTMDGSQVTVWLAAAPFVSRFAEHVGTCHVRIAGDGNVLDSTEAPESFCANLAEFARAIRPETADATFAESDSLRFFQGHTRVLWFADATIASGVRNGPSIALRTLVRPSDREVLASYAEAAGVENAPAAAFLSIDAPSCSDEAAAGTASVELIVGREHLTLPAISSAYAQGAAFPMTFALDDHALTTLRTARAVELKACGDRFVRFGRPGLQALTTYFGRLDAIHQAAESRTPIADPTTAPIEPTAGGEAPPPE